MTITDYHQFVFEFARTFGSGKNYQLGGFSSTVKNPPLDTQNVLLFSPHPDDECITGALPLRLLREIEMRIVNVAVTLGSNQERRRSRHKELKGACAYLGFELLLAHYPDGLQHINKKTHTSDSKVWKVAVESVKTIIQEYKPTIVFFPNRQDWHPTHIGTHYLVCDALKAVSKEIDFQCFTIETEFWRAIQNPNLMIESTVRDVGDLMAALSFHIGEVQRNPYHLRLPAWMIDNVRRGSELIGGVGFKGADFMFATLYRLNHWNGKRFINVLRNGKYVSGSTNDLLKLPFISSLNSPKRSFSDCL